MEGGGRYYVILLVVSSLPDRVYVCSINYYALGLKVHSVVQQVIPVTHLMQVPKGLPGIYNRSKVLTYQSSDTKSATHIYLIQTLKILNIEKYV